MGQRLARRCFAAGRAAAGAAHTCTVCRALATMGTQWRGPWTNGAADPRQLKGASHEAVRRTAAALGAKRGGGVFWGGAMELKSPPAPMRVRQCRAYIFK